MSPFILVVAIVPRGKGTALIEAACSGGAAGGTIVTGRGTASNKVLQVLGLGSSEKEIAYTVVPAEKRESVIHAVRNFAFAEKRGFGILFTLDVMSKWQGGQIQSGEYTMQEIKRKLITLIINKGYAEDAMAAARAAGASGGTVINARGTAREGDAKFFGVTIVPEKEMLLLIVDNEKADAVFEAVRNLPCLAAPGSGIMYSSPAADFTLLGRK